MKCPQFSGRCGSWSSFPSHAVLLRASTTGRLPSGLEWTSCRRAYQNLSKAFYVNSPNFGSLLACIYFSCNIISVIVTVFFTFPYLSIWLLTNSHKTVFRSFSHFEIVTQFFWKHQFELINQEIFSKSNRFTGLINDQIPQRRNKLGWQFYGIFFVVAHLILL